MTDCADNCISSSRSAFFTLKNACAIVGTNTAVAGFNSWLGGQILHSAGWAPIAVSQVTYSGALGGMGLAFPIAVVMRYLVQQYDGDFSLAQCDAFTLSACSSLLSFCGAACILELPPAGAGYAAAAGGIGGVVTAVGVLTLVGAVVCGERLLICCRTEDRQTVYVMGHNMPYNSSVITQQNIQDSVLVNGLLYADQINNSFESQGLYNRGREFQNADNALKDMIYYPQSDALKMS